MALVDATDKQEEPPTGWLTKTLSTLSSSSAVDSSFPEDVSRNTKGHFGKLLDDAGCHQIRDPPHKDTPIDFVMAGSALKSCAALTGIRLRACKLVCRWELWVKMPRTPSVFEPARSWSLGQYTFEPRGNR